MTLVLAKIFRDKVRATLSIVELIEIDELNATPAYERCCASHNFFDASICMCEAFRLVTGLELATSSDLDMDLVTRAWASAKRMGFSWSLLEYWRDIDGTEYTFNKALELCKGNPEVDTAPLVVLYEVFGTKDPRYCLDMQRRVKEHNS